MPRTIMAIKPCPFCGRTPTVDDCGDNSFLVRCECGIVQDKLYGQRCDALRQWNERTPKTVDKDLYDAVREQRDIAVVSLGMIYARYGENFDDVVKVVRCKDCKRRHQTTCPFLIANAYKTSTDDDFCSMGERREDDCN